MKISIKTQKTFISAIFLIFLYIFNNEFLFKVAISIFFLDKALGSEWSKKYCSSYETYINKYKHERLLYLFFILSMVSFMFTPLVNLNHHLFSSYIEINEKIFTNNFTTPNIIYNGVLLSLSFISMISLFIISNLMNDISFFVYFIILSIIFFLENDPEKRTQLLKFILCLMCFYIIKEPLFRIMAENQYIMKKLTITPPYEMMKEKNYNILLNDEIIKKSIKVKNSIFHFLLSVKELFFITIILNIVLKENTTKKDLINLQKILLINLLILLFAIIYSKIIKFNIDQYIIIAIFFIACQLILMMLLDLNLKLNDTIKKLINNKNKLSLSIFLTGCAILVLNLGVLRDFDIIQYGLGVWSICFLNESIAIYPYKNGKKIKIAIYISFSTLLIFLFFMYKSISPILLIIAIFLIKQSYHIYKKTILDNKEFKNILDGSKRSKNVLDFFEISKIKDIDDLFINISKFNEAYKKQEADMNNKIIKNRKITHQQHKEINDFYQYIKENFQRPEC